MCKGDIDSGYPSPIDTKRYLDTLCGPEVLKMNGLEEDM